MRGVAGGVSIDQAAFDRVADVLASGRAAVFPTDTVYGIGVAVGRASSPDEIYRVKRRDPEKAIPWLVQSADALARYGRDVPAYAHALAEAFWPGPLTLIVRAGDAAPRAFCSEDASVALRMPDDAAALALIARVGCPIATSSANFQGHTPPQSFDRVDAALIAQVAACAGDGRPRSGISSTIVDCTGAAPRLVRLGAIGQDDIDRACEGLR